MFWSVVFVLITLLFAPVIAQDEVGTDQDWIKSTPQRLGEDPLAAPEPKKSKYTHGLPTRGDSSATLEVKRRGKKAITHKIDLKKIDTCDTKHSIGFRLFLNKKLNCNFQSRIHPNGVTFLNNHLHECSAEGLKSLGIDKPISRVVISSQGVYSKRKVDGSSQWSNHSLGAAIDMYEVEIEFEDGTKESYDTAAVNLKGNNNPGFSRCKTKCKGQRYYKSGQALFYVGFEKCMKEKIAKIIEDKKDKGILCSGGVLGCDHNAAHANHIHLSIPICPKPEGVAGI